MNNKFRTADKIIDTLTRVSIYIGILSIVAFGVGRSLIDNNLNNLVKFIILIIILLIVYIIIKIIYDRHCLTIRDNKHKLLLQVQIGNITRHKYNKYIIYEYNNVPFMFIGQEDSDEIIDEHKTIKLDNNLVLGYVEDYTFICNKHYENDYNRIIQSVKDKFNDSEHEN